MSREFYTACPCCGMKLKIVIDDAGEIASVFLCEETFKRVIDVGELKGGEQ